MKKFVKSIFRSVKPLIDILLSPITLIGAVYFRFGINFNEQGQLALLSRFHFNEELRNIPLESTGELNYR